ncbi:AAA family ATPase [Nostoc sp. CHAB 5836]|nr:AAA family ATPase [Nostoc sp. CHAB 5836]
MTTEASTSSDVLPKIPGYAIVEQLYLGSRTAVYRAVEVANERPVVIKVLRREYPSFGELVQFRNQYTIAKNLPIPAIVQPLSLEPLGNSYALVMEDFGGVSLSKYTQQQSLRLIEVLAIALQVAYILHDLCQHRVVHKDIKPANILICPESKQVKLIDFSIASLLPKETQEIQSPNILEGTLAYLAPEQTGRMNRGIDYRADFYALGVTLYQLLTGTLPFTSDDPLELVHCHIAKLPVAVDIIKPDVPKMVAAIVGKLMAKNAEDRYQSALGLKYDLQQCLSQWKETGKIAEFALGERDLSDRFLIPEKLYGRENEVKSLLAAFERVADGASELILVAGFSGIGKTAVVNEVHKPIVRQRGYFIKGKFDQFNRNIPLSAFVQALRDLMGQLLSESDTQLAQWQAQILSAVGDNGQVLIEVIPELEQVIGKQPAVPELSGSAAQNRFNLLFQKFIQVFTTVEHPLVMFLDDLQWADSASLQLIKLLMNDNGYLLILGAYRDNEVSPAHPFILTVEELKKAQAMVNTITLAPLGFADTNHLVADTLNCSRELEQPLTELIDRKTKGNPFFTTQFLKALHNDGQIIFDHHRRYWECDIAQVKALSVTHDVVEFMAVQLQKLPPETQQVLKLAACVGNQFDLATLAIVCEQSQTNTATALWKALQEGLIIPTSQVYKFFQDGEQADTHHNVNPTYRFLHDRIQQAAYFLIPEDQKQQTHYHIGKLLLSKLSEVEQSETIFKIVNHINLGQSLLKQKDEKEKVARLNLTAAQKAIASTAYEAGIKYLETSIGLLEKDDWISQYDLMFNLYRNLCAAQLSSASYEQLSATITISLKYISSPVDRAEIYVFQVTQYTVQGQCEKAIQIGLIGLNDLGIEIKGKNLTELVREESAAVVRSLEDHSISSLLNLPIAIDPVIQATIKLLMTLEPPAYITANIELYSFNALRAVRLSIEHGNIAESILAYADYGFYLGVMEGQYQQGYEFADLAVQLSYKLNSQSQHCQAAFLLGAFIHVWTKPIAGAAAINNKGFLAGMESGEIQFAAYNLVGNIFNRLFQGEYLIAVAADIERYGLLAERHQEEVLRVALAGAKIFVTRLGLAQAQEDDQSFSKAEAIIRQGETSQTLLSVCLYYILRIYLACLTANFEQGYHYFIEAGKILTAALGFTTYSGYYYYGSLILLNLYPGLSQAEQSKALEQIRSHQERLKTWSDNCPENFLHKYLLVEAERCRVLGSKSDAINLYDLAISGAKANGYIQEEALANELAAKFYLNWGKEKIAASYMQDAYYGYAHWGAKAKVQDLERRYAHLLAPILQQQRTSLSATETVFAPDSRTELQASGTHSSTSGNTSISTTIDLATVLKASQTLSSQIQLNKLLATLLHLVLENAGADKGALLMPRDNQWFVEAIAPVDQPARVESIILSNSQEISHVLINTVKRSLQPVVIVDAAIHPTLAKDAYVVQHQPKSMLCTPIQNQGKLVAILYLENHVTVGAFTSDRVELLNILCAQIAISLTNARLHIQEQEKSQQLQESLEQLQKSETHLRQLFEGSADAILLLADGMFIDCNPATVNMMHCHNKQEFLSLHPSKLSPELQPDGRASFEKANEMIATAFQKGTHRFEWMHRRVDGEDFWVEVVLTVMSYKGKTILHTVWREIGDRKASETLIQEKNKALEQALTQLQQSQAQVVQSEKMSALGNLVAGVAHEINNPIGFLNGSINNAQDYVQDMIGHLALYQQHYPDPAVPIQENAEDIDLEFLCQDLPNLLNSMTGASDRIKGISNSLRTFSRADTEYKVSANLHEGIDSTLLILKYRLKANEHRPMIEVIQDYGDLPAIPCFPGQLNQVFMNILANAIDVFDEIAQTQSFQQLQAHPQQITIRTQVIANQVQITIQDNGKGMSAEVKGRIFDHLFTTKAVGKGTGLGLAIARQIVVEKHGGAILVDSTLGQGTEFTIQLPIRYY